MAKGKKSFVLYSDQKELFEHLSDEQAGKLIKHIFKYVNDENPETEDPFIKLAFLTIKASLKRDLSKWEKQLKQRSEAGKASAEKRKRNSTTVNERKRNSTDNVNVSDNVNDIKEIPPTPKGELHFKYDVYLEEINKMFGRNHKVVSDKLKRSIQARLREGYKKINFYNAMVNVKNNDFHKETNYVHVDPYFFAQESKLSKYGDKIRNDNKTNQIGAKTEYYQHD